MIDPPRPDSTGFMDADMRRAWLSMRPSSLDMRLVGGTALALYLNHRRSTDFDFMTPEVGAVDPVAVRDVVGVEFDEIVGGPGMVDARLAGRERSIRFTFMEPNPIMPAPLHPPLTAANGVAVAHPADLIGSKMRAIETRDAVRDYIDLAAAIDAWPQHAASMAERPDAGRLVRLLGSVPAAVRGQLDFETVTTLQSFAGLIVEAGSPGR